MKNKIFIMAIAAMMALSLAGCSESKTEETTKPAETTVEETTEAPAETKATEAQKDEEPADDSDDEDYDTNYMRSYGDITDDDIKYAEEGDVSPFVTDPDLLKLAEELKEKKFDTFMSPEAFIENYGYFAGDGYYYFKNGFGAASCGEDHYHSVMAFKAPQALAEEMVFLGDEFESEEKDGIISYSYNGQDQYEIKYDKATQIFTVDCDEDVCPKG